MHDPEGQFSTPPNSPGAEAPEVEASSPVLKKFHKKRHNFLSTVEKTQLVAEHLRLKNRTPKPKGDLAMRVAKKFNIDRKQVFRTLKTFKNSGDFSREKGSGAKVRVTPTKEKALIEQARKAGFKTTYRGLETALKDVGSSSKGISKSTIHRHVTTMGWKVVRRQTKPKLTSIQEGKRYEWCDDLLKNPKKVSVDLDESWVFGFELSGSLKVPPGEEIPTQAIQSKRYIDKIMMLSAISAPDKKHKFDGKLCFSRVSETTTAVRRSQDHEKGDEYEKDCTMTSGKFHSMLKEDVIPAIQEKMSWAKKVWVQMDNAPPHVGNNGLELLNQYCSEMTHPKIEFFTQPAQSPDLNANDLGFFNSIKKKIDYSYVGMLRKEQIFEVAQKAFKDYPQDSLAQIFRAKKYRISQVHKDLGKFTRVVKTT